MAEYNYIKYKNFYFVWQAMKRRCLNIKVPEYNRYGGRGIKIDRKWLSFKGFFIDMHLSYKKGLTLERINNNKGYYKSNCKWATRKQQANNTRTIEKALRYFFNGKLQTIREWAEELGIKRTTLDMRLRQYKWPIEKALLKGGY